jgi:hypothetical protein
LRVYKAISQVAASLSITEVEAAKWLDVKRVEQKKSVSAFQVLLDPSQVEAMLIQ